MNELLINQESVKEPELIADTTFESQKITDLNVRSEMLKIKASKATEPDRISPKLSKDSVETIAESLTNIFNKFIEFGIFPDDFKAACISPIDKGIAN